MSSFVVNDKSFADFTTAGGVSFSRAGVGYGETAAGLLVPFASGAYRRTDRGVLLEEARTNSWPTSFSGTAAALWPTVASATVALGSLTPRVAGASTVLITTTGTNGRAQRNITIPVDTVTRTFSVDVQKKAQTYAVAIGCAGGTSVSNSLTFDGLTGAISAGVGRVVSKNTDWWRVEVSVTNNGTAGNVTLFGFVQLTGASGLTAEVALPQFEDGASATSYIATSAASATRPRDSLREVGAAIQAPWTMFTEAEFLGSTGINQVMLCMSVAGSSNDRCDIYRDGTGKITIVATSGGVNQYVKVGATSYVAQVVRAAIAFDGTTYTSSIAGVGQASGAGAALAGVIDQIDYGQLNTSTLPLNSILRKAGVKPYAMSQAELNAWTA